MATPGASVKPFGQLISFETAGGLVSFRDGHSKRVAEPDAPRHAVGAIAGSERSYDLYGRAPAPIDDPTWHYEYWLEAIEGQDVATVRGDLQAKKDALLAICTGLAADGSSLRVGTLTVEHWGGASASTTARLIDVRTMEFHYTLDHLSVVFLVPGGFVSGAIQKAKE